MFSLDNLSFVIRLPAMTLCDEKERDHSLFYPQDSVMCFLQNCAYEELTLQMPAQAHSDPGRLSPIECFLFSYFIVGVR